MLSNASRKIYVQAGPAYVRAQDDCDAWGAAECWDKGARQLSRMKESRSGSSGMGTLGSASAQNG